jgi:hypothetical protein
MEAEPPPLLTASWIRRNVRELTELQLAGELCVYCGGESRTMVPVGQLGARQLFACLPACEPARGPDRP